MLVEKVETFVLAAPLGDQRFYSSQAAFPQRTSLLVKITTDDGIVGWGEGGQYGPPQPVATAIDAVLAPEIVGKPVSPGVVWDRLYAFSRDFGRTGTYVEAISAIDIALHDILGKSLGVPVHVLLGGAFRDSVKAYATGCYYRGEGPFDDAATLAALRDEATGYVAAGFDILKLKCGLLTVESDLKRTRAIRDAVGDEIVLLMDANHGYNATTAIRCGLGLQDLDIRWFEEPVPPEDREGYRQVRAALHMPITGGECAFTRFDFRDLIVEGCIDIAQPDICCTGGFTEWRHIMGIASAHGVRTIPHVWGSGVALAAALQVLAATPPLPFTYFPIELQNEPVVEFDRNPNPLRDELLADPICLEGGRVAVPMGPGLGIHIDEEVLARYRTV